MTDYERLTQRVVIHPDDTAGTVLELLGQICKRWDELLAGCNSEQIAVLTLAVEDRRAGGE